VSGQLTPVIPTKAGTSNQENKGINTKNTLEEICARAEIDESLLDRKAVSLSGGQRQRVAIARAIAPAPDLLICDESVSALDVVVQNSILATLQKLREQKGLAILFVTHDLSVVRMLADRVYVMKNSKIVESGETEKLFAEPKDPYTYELLVAAGIK
jgi:peptide/nickel transport system ATP-binding protein